MVADVRRARTGGPQLGLAGLLVLLVPQLGAATVAGATFLAATAEPPVRTHDGLSLVPLVSRSQRSKPRPRAAARARVAEPPTAAPPTAAPPTAAPPTAAERPTMEAVLAAVTEQSDSAQDCMQRAFEGGDLVRDTSYRFNLDWVIAPDGSVGGAHVSVPPGVNSSSLAPCLRQAMARWRFPASQRGVKVRRFPFHFTVR